MPIKVIRTKEKTVFGVSDIYGIKLLTLLKSNSHFQKHFVLFASLKAL